MKIPTHHMFLRQVTSLRSSFLPQLALLRAFRSSSASSSHLPQVPAPHPWWSVRGFPPWPLHLLPPSPPACHLFSRAAPSHNAHSFSGSWRSFHVSGAGAGLMERRDEDRGPPHKRRKSVEEKMSHEDKEGHRGGAPGGTGGQAEEGGPQREHCRLDPGAASSSGLQPPGGRTAFDFSVLSYNILSQDLLHDNAYLYRHCGPGVLSWENRLPNLLAEIQHYNADVVCLQEVQEDHYHTQIRPALQRLGYQCEYKKRTGRKPDGCAVVFKSSRLSLLSSNPVEFFRPGNDLLDRDNVGLVLLLRPNDGIGQSDPSAFICIANTHLLYNPRRGDIKLAQLAILLAEIHRMSRLPDGSTSPVVVCGDFNSTPWSPLYHFLTTGCLQYQGLPIGRVSGQEDCPRSQRLLTSPIWSNSLGINQHCQYETNTPGVEGAISNLTVEDLIAKAAFNSARIEHSVKLQSSYRHFLHDGRPEITTHHSRTALTVDYILYTPDSVTSSSLPGGRGLQLLGRLSLVGQSELEAVNGLPNRHHSSDHLPLLARFRLRR
ncbi:protein angel homolog 2 [Diretmus argenteus]